MMSKTFRKNAKSHRKKSNVRKSRSFRKKRNEMRGGYPRELNELIHFLNARGHIKLSNHFSKCKLKSQKNAVKIFDKLKSDPKHHKELIDHLTDVMDGRTRKRSAVAVATPAEVVPPTREQLLERRLALIESLHKLRDEWERNEDDFLGMRMRHIQREIDEIEFQLKTPEEQAAILARQEEQKAHRAQMRAVEQLEEQRRLTYLHEQKAARKSEQNRLDRERSQAVLSEEKQRVKEWEQEHLSQLKDKSFVQSQLRGLQAHHEALTAEGQPRGATLGYPIWYDLMIELLRKYERGA